MTGYSKPVCRSDVTRGLHLLLLLIVVNQLVGSQFMEKPLPGEGAEWPFVLHEWIGVAGFATLVLFWVWTLVRHPAETSLARLLPWFSVSGWRDVLADVGRGVRGAVGGGALASAIHGLGLLVASAMAASGFAYFVFFAGTPLGAFVLGLHKLLANFMWAYLIGHASMAALHAVLGDDVVARMFWLRRRKADPVEFP